MSKPLNKVLGEGFFVGIFVIIISICVAFMLKAGGYPKTVLPAACDSWNDTYIMQVNLFLTGFLFHVIFEYAGLNKWYAVDYVKSYA
jgi:hypothetical protein